MAEVQRIVKPDQWGLDLVLLVGCILNGLIILIIWLCAGTTAMTASGENNHVVEIGFGAFSAS